MPFPFGRPILAMICSALIAGIIIACRTIPSRTDLTLWVSRDLHARMYQNRISSPSLLEDFTSRTGKSVQLDLIAEQAMDVRLLALFMFSSGRQKHDDATPDVVEISLGSIGKYFRPPVDEVGFLPLNDYLQKSGWMDRIAKTRFAPWTKDSKIFGIPHDLHPSTLTYRKDLFDQAGIDLESAATWPELQDRCLKFQAYWKAHGRPRTAMGMSSTTADMLLVMLRQQHVELVDAELNPHFTDPKTINTLAWYARAVAGEKQIATTPNPAPGQNAVDLATGDICGLITPDWMVADLKEFGAGSSGKLRMIPLPTFSPDDAPTASWGGTMIGITRTCRQPDLAWKLIEDLYLEHKSSRIRQDASGILPPIPEYWSDPVYHEPDPFYEGEKIAELYIRLAGQMPDVHMTAYTAQAQIFFAIALNSAVMKARAGDADLESSCRKSLASAQDRLMSMIRFDAQGN